MDFERRIRGQDIANAKKLGLSLKQIHNEISWLKALYEDESNEMVFRLVSLLLSPSVFLSYRKAAREHVRHMIWNDFQESRHERLQDNFCPPSEKWGL